MQEKPANAVIAIFRDGTGYTSAGQGFEL